MPTYKITFKLTTVTCVSCTNTIAGAWSKIISSNTFRLNENTKLGYVWIALDSAAKIPAFADRLIQAADEVGHEVCYIKNDLDSAVSLPKSVERLIPVIGDLNHEVKVTAIPEWHKAALLCVSGLSLMLAEHFMWLPTPTTTLGLSLNLILGGISTLLTLWGGHNYFKHAFFALRKFQFTSAAMDYLISIASMVSLSYSFLLLGNFSFLAGAESATYFSVPLALLGLLKLSHSVRDQLKEKINRQKTTVTLAQENLPTEALIYHQGQTELKPIKEIEVGTELLITKGQRIPIDCKLKSELATVRSDFYGEKGDLEIKIDQPLYAGSENIGGDIIVVTTAMAAENLVSRMEASFNQYQTKATYLQQVIRWFFPTVLAIALGSAAIWGWWIGGENAAAHALQVFLTVIMSACPCGIGLTELLPSITKNIALQQNLLILHDAILDSADIKELFVDKSGTLTPEKYELVGIDCEEKAYETYLSYARAIEMSIPELQRNTIAQAICKVDSRFNYLLEVSKDDTAWGGKAGRIDGQDIVLGNQSLLQKHNIVIPEEWLAKVTICDQEHLLPIFLAVDQKIVAILKLKVIGEEDCFRPGTELALQWLLTQNIPITVLTGDEESRARSLIGSLKFPVITESTPLIRDNKIDIRARQKPKDKETAIATASQQHAVGFVGDDSNDAAAMKKTVFSFAISSQAPTSKIANSVLNGSLLNLVQLILLSRQHKNAEKISLSIAFGINAVSILFATGMFYPLTKTLLSPMINMGVMASSSLLLMMYFAYYAIRTPAVMAEKAIHKSLSSSSWCLCWSRATKDKTSTASSSTSERGLSNFPDP